MLQTKVQLTALKTDTERYLQKHPLQSLAQKAGLGTKVIDNLLAENFEAIPEHHLKQIHMIVKRNYKDGLHRTADSQAFLKAVDMAVKHTMCVGITGDTGTGKSFMSRAVAKKANVLYWNCELMHSPREFFSALSRDLRISCGGSISEMIDRVAVKINDMEEPLVIIDEMDKCHKAIRSCIKTLRDRTEQKAGLLLVGMPAFKNDLLRGKEAGKQGYSEMWRRVNIWHHLGGLRPEEIKAVLTDAGITEPEAQREFRQYTSFGELVNAIELHKLLND